MFVLNEPRLFGIFNKKSKKNNRWQACLSHNITGIFEGYSINENKNLMTVVTSQIIKNDEAEFNLQHNFRYYKNLECEYPYIKQSTNANGMNCNQNNNDKKGITCNMHADYLNSFDIMNNTDIKSFNSFYEDFSISGTSNILNIAVTDNLIAYTTLMNRFHLFYSYK